MKQKLLIVGAGPVGLAAALFVSSNPLIQIDIIQKVGTPRSMVGSKALSINPRTMSLFTGYPIQQQLIKRAIKVSQFKLKSEDNKVIIQNNIRQIIKDITPFNNIFIYPQCQTQQLLEDQINKKGIKVKRGVEALSIQQKQNGVQVLTNQSQKKQFYSFVLGADGSKSTIRKSLKVNFPGETLKERLYVADYINLGEPFYNADMIVGQEKTLLFFPVKDNIIRIVTNFEDYEQKCKQYQKIGQCLWKSDFQINNRHTDKMSVGDVYLAGDSAHIHAPIGGRGMNLGIQDAFIFSHLLKEGRLNEYHSLRYPVVSNFVESIKRASIILKKDHKIFRTMVPYIAPIGNYFARKQGILFITGLDHQIPFIPRL